MLEDALPAVIVWKKCPPVNLVDQKVQSKFKKSMEPFKHGKFFGAEAGIKAGTDLRGRYRLDAFNCGFAGDVNLVKPELCQCCSEHFRLSVLTTGLAAFLTSKKA